MLSIFLRAGKCEPEEPTHRKVMGDGDGAPPDIKSGIVVDDELPDSETSGVIGVCEGLLASIVANSEYLELVYGRSLPVQNILEAADRLKTAFQKLPRR